MNKTKLAVFCCLVIVAIMSQMDVDAAGSYGTRSQQAQSTTQTAIRKGKSDRPYQGRRGDRGWRGGKQQEGQRRKGTCKGDTCARKQQQQATAKPGAAQQAAAYEDEE